MHYKLPLVLLIILFSSCHSLTQSRAELGIPESRVYFSFDDGPEAQRDTTARLLDVLKRHQIKALFCLLGENAEEYPDLVRRIHDEGHYIVNHGYADKWARKMNRDKFRNNIIQGENAISAAMGFNLNPKLYRPHGGSIRSGQKKIFIDEGYTFVPTTVRVYDAVSTASGREKIIKKVIGKLEKQGGGIVLLHDGRGSHSNQKKELEKNPEGAFNRSWIPETTEEIITMLLERGFILNGPDIFTGISSGVLPGSNPSF